MLRHKREREDHIPGGVPFTLSKAVSPWLETPVLSVLLIRHCLTSLQTAALTGVGGERERERERESCAEVKYLITEVSPSTTARWYVWTGQTTIALCVLLTWRKVYTTNRQQPALQGPPTTANASTTNATALASHILDTRVGSRSEPSPGHSAVTQVTEAINVLVGGLPLLPGGQADSHLSCSASPNYTACW